MPAFESPVDDGSDPATKTTTTTTTTSPEGAPAKLSHLLAMGDDSEFEDQMRDFQSRLLESSASQAAADRRAKRSAQLKTAVDPNAFAKLLASKRQHASLMRASKQEASSTFSSSSFSAPSSSSLEQEEQEDDVASDAAAF
jgi:hypothetical protein